LLREPHRGYLFPESYEALKALVRIGPLFLTDKGGYFTSKTLCQELIGMIGRKVVAMEILKKK